MSIDSLLTQLTVRLPELAWKLNQLDNPINPNILPKGLFQSSLEPSTAHYIQEIKHDIQRLAKQRNLLAASHLAAKINQKINVLVQICQQQTDKQKTKKNNLIIESLCTRQQWLQKLEQQLAILTEQKQALSQRMQQREINSTLQLKLQAELGELEKQLTLAQEAYNKACSN